MNTKRLFRIALFTFFAVGLAACNKDDGERWYDSMKDGGPCQTGHWVRFYYIDSEGNDLIDPNDPATLPVSSETRLDVPPAPPTNFDAVAEGYYRYNDHKNDIQYDKVEGLYCFFTFAFGDSRYGDYDFYVYFEGVPDTMSVRYRYRDKRLGDGSYLCQVQTWKVNGELVYSLDQPTFHKKVFLCRTPDGKTTVSLSR